MHNPKFFKHKYSCLADYTYQFIAQYTTELSRGENLNNNSQKIRNKNTQKLTET